MELLGKDTVQTQSYITSCPLITEQNYKVWLIHLVLGNLNVFYIGMLVIISHFDCLKLQNSKTILFVDKSIKKHHW